MNRLRLMDGVGRRSPLIWLLGVVVLAIGLRAWGIQFGLPYAYHPDESLVITKSQEMLKTWDLHPRFFHWPSLIFYLNTLVYGVHFLLGKALGIFQTTADIPAPTILGMAVGYISMPTIWLSSRLLTMSFGVGSVVLTFVNGRLLTSKWSVGIMAGLLVAISPTNVNNSRFIAPDTFATFFALLAFYAIIQVFYTGQSRYYLLTGLAVGLATSSKYNSALIGLPLIVAHFYHYGTLGAGWFKKGLRDWRLVGAGLLSIITFLLTTPYAVLDWPMFWEGIQFNATHYGSGHAGMEGDSLRWYLAYLWRAEGLIFFLALLEIGRGLYSRSWPTLLLAVFPVIYFGLISSLVVRNDRTLLVATPFFMLLAAQWLGFGYEWLRQRPLPWRRYGQVMFGLVAVVVIAIPLMKTIQQAQRLTIVDSRETARVWIAEQLPTGSKIAFEAYSPYLDPSQFRPQYVPFLTDHPLATYEAEDVDYMVFSFASYGRFFLEPEKYANEIAAYEQIWAQLELVRLFNDGGYEVRIYAIQ